MITRGSFSLVLSALGLAIVGCGCGSPCEDLDPSQAWVELGTGDQSFTPVEDGDSLGLTWGPQGGQHIWGALRVSGLALGPLPGPPSPLPFAGPMTTEDMPLVSLRVDTAAGKLARFPAERRAFDRPEAGVGEAVGITVFAGTYIGDAPWLYPEGLDESTFTPDDWAAAEQYMVDLVQSSEFIFRVDVEDRCGTVVTNSRTIRIDSSTLETSYVDDSESEVGDDDDDSAR